MGLLAIVVIVLRAEASRVEAIGLATARATEALGLARAEGYKAQVEALGQGGIPAGAQRRLTQLALGA